MGTWARLIGLEKEAAPLILQIDVSDVFFILGSPSSREEKVTRQLI
jgi:hypothetical protein